LHRVLFVVLGAAGGGGAAAAAAAGSARVTIKGVTATGYLLAVDEKGTRYELHPDGNSLDFFKGLVRKKLPS
jgi:biotin--protein ligase